MRNKSLYLILALPLGCLLLVGLYFVPPVHSRLAWRIDEWTLQARYWLHPPQQAVFVPQGQTTQKPAPAVRVTHRPTDTVFPAPATEAPPSGPTATPAPSATSAPSPTPLPGKISLKGVRYEDQHARENYCAPANLAMALSFWGWKGNKDVVGPVIKPDPKDKNVMPYEMAAYVTEKTDLKAAVRMAGDNDLLRRFLAAGFPVLVEKGVRLTDMTNKVSWMGHYEVVTGYDDARKVFITQDSFIKPDYEVPYDVMQSNWRSFNYTYVLIYSADKEAQVMALLGPDADETANYQHAAQKASDEIFALTGLDQFFAWYNRGTSLVQLQDYTGAAGAYDNAFALYAELPEDQRPWRMVWYQTGPYYAYFYSGRYYDVISLANTTFDAMQSEKNLEESYYWRGMAKAALGDTAGAIEDFRSAVQYHAGFEPAIFQLNKLGASG